MINIKKTYSIILPEGKILVKYNAEGEIIQSIASTAILNNMINLDKFILIDKPEEN